MHRSLRILRLFASFLSAAAVWLVAATQALAKDLPQSKPEEGGMTDYMLSYLVVILGVALGILVVAKASTRRDRERPAGYVQKNLVEEE